MPKVVARPLEDVSDDKGIWTTYDWGKDPIVEKHVYPYATCRESRSLPEIFIDIDNQKRRGEISNIVAHNEKCKWKLLKMKDSNEFCPYWSEYNDPSCYLSPLADKGSFAVEEVTQAEVKAHKEYIKYHKFVLPYARAVPWNVSPKVKMNPYVLSKEMEASLKSGTTNWLGVGALVVGAGLLVYFVF